MGGTSVGGAKGAGEARAPQGQLAATTTSLEAAARLAVFEPGVRQTFLITRVRSTRRTKRVRVPYQYVAELVSRARGAGTVDLSRACLVDFPHGVRGREEEGDGADDRLHFGRPARKLVERRRARAPRREHGAPLVFAALVCTTVTSRRGAAAPARRRIPVAATSQFSLSESRPRGPCGGCPPRASSPRRAAAGRFMLAQTIVTLLRQQGDARHRRSRPQCRRVCKV